METVLITVGVRVRVRVRGSTERGAYGNAINANMDMSPCLSAMEGCNVLVGPLYNKRYHPANTRFQNIVGKLR